MAKIRDKAYVLNREKYKAIKKYDHQQMEDFCTSIYESGYRTGYETGCKAAVETISKNIVSNIRIDTINEVLQAAAQVKGIGPKKLEEISAILEAGHEKI